MKTFAFWTATLLLCYASKEGEAAVAAGAANAAADAEVEVAGGSLREGDFCATPDSEAGSCVPLRRCSTLFAIVRRKPLDPAAVAFLRQAECGFAKPRVRVFCCAARDIVAPQVTPSPSARDLSSTSPSARDLSSTSPSAEPPIETSLATSPASSTSPVPPTPSDAAVSSTTRAAATTTATTTTAAAMPLDDAALSNEAGGEGASEASGEDLESHPNRRLLPVDCGPTSSLDLSSTRGAAEAALGEHPWTVLLLYQDGEADAFVGCAGVLVSRLYVLTAAHCTSFGNPHGHTLVWARVGEHELGVAEDCREAAEVGGEVCADPAVDVPVVREIVHPEFSRVDASREHDVALLQLDESVVSNIAELTPICLPLPSNLRQRNFDESVDVYVAGWGIRGPSQASASKWAGSAFFLNGLTCASYFARLRKPAPTRGQTCAVSERLRNDTCMADDGGALARLGAGRVVAVAVASRALPSCPDADAAAAAMQPAVFTRVDTYLGWLLDQLEP